MNPDLYRNTFRRQHAFLAVVHAQTFEQAERNVAIAKEEGADGVFLINHDSGYENLLRIYDDIRKMFPGFWIGLNCLNMESSLLKPVEVIPKATAGLWIDNAGINESQNPTGAAEYMASLRRLSGWSGLCFGGVAFKYQTPIKDPAKAAFLATRYVEVITTSGEGTGKAANLEKIKVMKEAAGDHPLAIASGITPENVHLYMPYADCFLVATGISDSHTELNAKRVGALVKALKG